MTDVIFMIFLISITKTRHNVQNLSKIAPRDRQVCHQKAVKYTAFNLIIYYFIHLPAKTPHTFQVLFILI